MSSSCLRGQVRFGGCGSSLHSGIEFGRSRTSEGSSGGRKILNFVSARTNKRHHHHRGGVRSGPGSSRTILLFHTISARPPKQPLFFFSRGLGRRIHLGVEVTESSTNKQHHH